MPDYKFDGEYLAKGNNRLARVHDDYIEDYQNNSKRVARIHNDYVEDYQNNSMRVAMIHDDYVEDCQNNSKRVAKVDDIKKMINGNPSKMQAVAFWWFFIR